MSLLLASAFALHHMSNLVLSGVLRKFHSSFTVSPVLSWAASDVMVYFFIHFIQFCINLCASHPVRNRLQYCSFSVTAVSANLRVTCITAPKAIFDNNCQDQNVIFVCFSNLTFLSYNHHTSHYHNPILKFHHLGEFCALLKTCYSAEFTRYYHCATVPP